MQNIYRIGWSRGQRKDCSVVAETREEAWKKFHDGDLYSELWEGPTFNTQKEIISVIPYSDDDEDYEHPDCGPENREV